MSESTAIEIQRPQLSITDEHRKLAKSTVAKDLTDAEFEMYIYNCRRQGIHPLDGMLVPIKRNDSEAGGKKLTFVTTVDLLRSRAAESGEYAGSEEPIFEYDETGTAKNPLKATVSVWRIVQGQRCMFTASARWEEFYPGDRQGFMWKSKPHVMLGKCAEAQALRKAFPKELAGIYASEEILEPEPLPEPVRPTQRKEVVKPQAVHEPAPQQSAQPQGEVIPPKGDPISGKQLNRLLAIQKSAGMTDEVLKAHLATLGITSRKLIPWKVYNQIIDFIDPKFDFHPKEEPKGQTTEEAF
jgi:phage recombination protein Bet